MFYKATIETKIRRYFTAVSLFWIFGIIAGIFAAEYFAGIFSSSSRAFLLTEPSVFGVFLSSFIPVAIAGLLTVFRKYSLLFITVFLKALIHSYSLSCGAAHLFAQSCCCLLMLFSSLWLYKLPIRLRSSRLIYILAAAFIICLVDCITISIA